MEQEKNYNRWLKKQLEELQEPQFQAFTSRLLPGTQNIIGVRLPKLRVLAKHLAAEGWEHYLTYALDDSFEEIMVQGMVLGYAQGDLTKKREYLDRFLPKIDNWSVCDSTCSSLKLAKQQPEEMWDYLKSCLRSQREYEVRFGLVQLLYYYINETYLERVLNEINSTHLDCYYVKMAQAWAVSICYREFPTETIPFLKENQLDDFTHNKALQKITESLKTGKEEKQVIRSFKREKM